eukprot:Tamp_19319.p1 GENE.Tamp_19319~~Tamp_19319.p1  ORF type:complete len:152 (-),score=12.08 Tamp_19319:718-1173(-)
MHDATFADFRPPAAAWRSAVPADGDYFALSLRLRGGFDPSVVTGLVLGFVLARMLSPPPPPPGPAGTPKNTPHLKKKRSAARTAEASEEVRQQHPFLTELETARTRASTALSPPPPPPVARPSPLPHVGSLRNVKMVKHIYTACMCAPYAV